MTTRHHAEPRTLFVLSRDFGELGLAMMLLQDQAFAGDAQLVLPQHMFAINEGALPVPASGYTTLDDILRVVDEHKPAVVFLLSAYLFAGDGLLSAQSLQVLLGRLREGGSQIVTSDPYIGLAPRLTLGDVNLRWHPAERMRRRAPLRLIQLLRPGRRVSHVPGLEDVIHLYPTQVPQYDDDIRRVAVFNPATIRSAGSAAAAGEESHDSVANERRHWLFVISRIDLYVQRKVLGPDQFIRTLRRLLSSTVEADRLPTLIAPTDVVDRLDDLRGSVELLTACPYVEYERRLRDAEYVFYWNAFSQSQQLRIVNGLPFFAFDRGHASRIVKPYYELARSCHFGGLEPPYLDQKQRLDASTLHDLAGRQRPGMAMLQIRYRRGLTPDAFIDQLCASGTGHSVSPPDNQGLTF